MLPRHLGAIGAILVAAASLPAAPARAQAVELRLLSPGAVTNAGLRDLAADFTAKTGIKTTLVGENMGRIADTARSGEPATDVVFVPIDIMSGLEQAGAVKPGSRVALGRAEIGLAVLKTAPTPDIATPAKLAAVLRTAKGVVYSNPNGGSLQAKLIDDMLKKPQFAGVNGVISTGGQGAAALARGQGDMALQLVSEILNYPELTNAGALPADLGVYIDFAAAVNARSAHAAEAGQFVAFVTRPEAAAVWRAKGLAQGQGVAGSNRQGGAQ